MKRIEALADAIAAYNGSKIPSSPAYQARNPLGLKLFIGRFCTGRLRHFDSWIGGYSAAVNDLHLKCSKQSNAKLEDQFHLQGLIRVYSLPDRTAGYVARFLRKALQDDQIRETTPLSYFVEN